uniref:Na(+)/H(+) exchange regulatory cofactor NHE-RF1 n=1 Tax=Gasterosteus aculeatus aculeatus TaxID=481459 RepID=A0AAQ4S7D9_GASAC
MPFVQASFLLSFNHLQRHSFLDSPNPTVRVIFLMNGRVSCSWSSSVWEEALPAGSLSKAKPMKAPLDVIPLGSSPFPQCQSLNRSLPLQSLSSLQWGKKPWDRPGRWSCPVSSLQIQPDPVSLSLILKVFLLLSSASSSSWGVQRVHIDQGEEERGGPRPRLCHVKKGAGGYGFNLHSEKTKPGQFHQSRGPGLPSTESRREGRGDKLVQVNRMSVIGMQHSEVVAAIKAGGDETTLLLVDAEAEDFFNRCNVVPTEEHVTGPLPEPASERASQEEEHQEEAAPERRAKVSVSSSASSASSTASLPAATREPPAAQAAPADGLGLSMSLAEAKERARQKRAAKKAPSMDWSKRNELFGNL